MVNFSNDYQGWKHSNRWPIWSENLYCSEMMPLGLFGLLASWSKPFEIQKSTFQEVNSFSSACERPFCVILIPVCSYSLGEIITGVLNESPFEWMQEAILHLFNWKGNESESCLGLPLFRGSCCMCVKEASKHSPKYLSRFPWPWFFSPLLLSFKPLVNGPSLFIANKLVESSKGFSARSIYHFSRERVLNPLCDTHLFLERMRHNEGVDPGLKKGCFSVAKKHSPDSRWSLVWIRTSTEHNGVPSQFDARLPVLGDFRLLFQSRTIPFQLFPCPVPRGPWPISTALHDLSRYRMDGRAIVGLLEMAVEVWGPRGQSRLTNTTLCTLDPQFVLYSY